jgi:hypothetical protein
MEKETVKTGMGCWPPIHRLIEESRILSLGMGRFLNTSGRELRRAEGASEGNSLMMTEWWIRAAWSS